MKRELFDKILDCIEEYKKEKALPPFFESEDLADKIADTIDEYEEDMLDDNEDESDDEVDGLYRY